MIKTIVLSVATINWVIGMSIFFFSKPGALVVRTGYERTGLDRYKVNYSVKEIRKAINLTNDKELKRDLRKKIFHRKIAFLLFASTPILIVLGNLLEK